MRHHPHILFAALSTLSVAAGCYDLADCETCEPPPVVPCPGDVHVSAELCGVTLGAGQLGSFAVPAGYHGRIDHMPTGGHFPFGKTSLDYVLLDAQGAQVQRCTQTVTVDDVSLPQVSPRPVDLYVDDDANLAEIVRKGNPILYPFDLGKCAKDALDACGGELALAEQAWIRRIEFWATKCTAEQCQCPDQTFLTEVCSRWRDADSASMMLVSATAALLPFNGLDDVLSGMSFYKVFFTVTGANGKSIDAQCDVNLFGHKKEEELHIYGDREPLRAIACVGPDCPRDLPSPAMACRL